MSTQTEYELDPAQVQWAEPPEGHGRWRRGAGGGNGRTRKYQDFVDLLAQSPKQWAIFRNDAVTGQSQDLRNYKELQVRNVPNGDGTSTIYARYMGLDENGQTALEPADRELRRARAQAQAERKAAKEAAAAEAAGETGQA